MFFHLALHLAFLQLCSALGTRIGWPSLGSDSGRGSLRGRRDRGALCSSHTLVWGLWVSASSAPPDTRWHLLPDPGPPRNAHSLPRPCVVNNSHQRGWESPEEMIRG